MATADVIVVGGGISGLSLAWKAGQAGRSARVLERDRGWADASTRSAGTTGTGSSWARTPPTTATARFLEVAVSAGRGRQDRRARPGPRQLRPAARRPISLAHAAQGAPRARAGWRRRSASRSGSSRRRRVRRSPRTTAGCIGRRNYERVLSPFFAAVPSQSADGFPLEGPGSLFKKRPRREDFVRSFGFDGGLQLVCDAAARARGVSVETGVEVGAGRAARATGFAVATADGRTLEAPVVAVAAPPDVAGRAAAPATSPTLAAAIGKIAHGGAGQPRRRAARARSAGCPSAPSWCRSTTCSSRR